MRWRRRCGLVAVSLESSGTAAAPAALAASPFSNAAAPPSVAVFHSWILVG